MSASVPVSPSQLKSALPHGGPMVNVAAPLISFPQSLRTSQSYWPCVAKLTLLSVSAPVVAPATSAPSERDEPSCRQRYETAPYCGLAATETLKCATPPSGALALDGPVIWVPQFIVTRAGWHVVVHDPLLI